jgi:hypothetical protein
MCQAKAVSDDCGLWDLPLLMEKEMFLIPIPPPYSTPPRVAVAKEPDNNNSFHRCDNSLAKTASGVAGASLTVARSVVVPSLSSSSTKE